jgi:hypothetical protein
MSGIRNRTITNPRTKYKYTLNTKVTWELHTLVQEIVSETGNSQQFVLQDLLNVGVDWYFEKKPEFFKSPKMRLIRDVKEKHDRDRMITGLVEIRDNISESKFLEYCSSLGIDPSEVDQVRSSIRKDKRERCRDFLTILFLDRPDGLPATRVLEIANSYGLGQNLVREVAKEEGIVFRREKISGQMASIWKPS